MRILQVINSLSGGGAETFMVDLSIALNRKMGVEVIVLTYSGVIDSKGEVLEDKLKKNGVRTIHLKVRNNLKKIFVPLLYMKVIREIRPSVIHSHLDQSDLFVAMIKNQFKKDRILFVRTLHNNGLIKRIPLFIHEKIFRKFDFNISCSQSVKENFQIAVLRDAIISINNGIQLDLEKFKINSSIQLNPSIPTKLNILSIGSFTPRHGVLQKGQDLLIAAVSNLKDIIDIKVTFLGDGSELEKYKSLVQSSNLQNTILFKGMVKDVRPYIDESDIICMPSRFEGLPIAAIEAAVRDKPLLVSNIAAFDPFFQESSIRFDISSLKDLELKIVEVSNEITNLSYQAKRNGPRYREVFDIGRVAEKYFEVYSLNVLSQAT